MATGTRKRITQRGGQEIEVTLIAELPEDAAISGAIGVIDFDDSGLVAGGLRE